MTSGTHILSDGSRDLRSLRGLDAKCCVYLSCIQCRQLLSVQCSVIIITNFVCRGLILYRYKLDMKSLRKSGTHDLVQVIDKSSFRITLLNTLSVSLCICVRYLLCRCELFLDT